MFIEYKTEHSSDTTIHYNMSGRVVSVYIRICICALSTYNTEANVVNGLSWVEADRILNIE